MQTIVTYISMIMAVFLTNPAAAPTMNKEGCILTTGIQMQFDSFMVYPYWEEWCFTDPKDQLC